MPYSGLTLVLPERGGKDQDATEGEAETHTRRTTPKYGNAFRATRRHQRGYRDRAKGDRHPHPASWESAAAGPAPDTIGLYLLTNETALDRTLDGLHARGFLAGFGLPEKLSRWVIRSPEILEQVCMCDEGSMIDISADGEPVHGPRPSSAAAKRARPPFMCACGTNRPMTQFTGSLRSGPRAASQSQAARTMAQQPTT